MLATADDNPAHLLVAMATDEETEQGVGDFLAIDDLLDFSNDDIIGGPIDSSLSTSRTTNVLLNAPSPCISPPELGAAISISNIASSPKLDKRITPDEQLADGTSVFDSDELCVPCDDLAELEWLSNFVEESFASGGDHVPASFCLASLGGAEESKTSKMSWTNESFHSTSPVSVLDRISAHSSKPISYGAASDTSVVPARMRSKRSRTAVCFWNTQILSAEASESILESSSTTASTITAASSESDMIPTTHYDGHEDDDDYEEDENENENEEEEEDINLDSFSQYSQQRRVDYPSNKVKKYNSLKDGMGKQKKRGKGGEVDDGVAMRKCIHCGSMKTPQWRAGPMGPKTLCNACGVRYKSGRLCAEYRPAASPTFNEKVHSNSHRKVMEIRKQMGQLSSPIIAKLPTTSRSFGRQDINAQYARVKDNLIANI